MDPVVDGLIQEMHSVFGDDRERIDHALAVLGHANRLRAVEGGDPLVIQAAAVLHDIGIHEAERKHGSAAGRYQEIEGPPIAGAILRKHGVGDDSVTHVCRIIANHHSARDIDTLEFRVLWDADWLVNWPEVFPSQADTDVETRINKVFKTNTGCETARRLFAGPQRSAD